MSSFIALPDQSQDRVRSERSHGCNLQSLCDSALLCLPHLALGPSLINGLDIVLRELNVSHIEV